MRMVEKRITILTGHYGSGKTSLAVALALDKRARGRNVTVADLDIVNPYFRSADCRTLLESYGIRLVASDFAGSNADLPALPRELYALAEDGDADAVFDVGGDERGALALSRYAPAIAEKGDYEQLFTVNFCRPLTQSAEDALRVMREVEAACNLPATAIVNNSNLGRETAAQDVLDACERAERLSRLCGLPVRFTSVDERIFPALAGKIEDLYAIQPRSMAIAQ